MIGRCPTCGLEYDRVWVVVDLDQPFGCTGCVRKRGLHAVEAPLAAREAWPYLDKDLRLKRVALALSADVHAIEEGSGLTSAAVRVDLTNAAARLMGRRRDSPTNPA